MERIERILRESERRTRRKMLIRRMLSKWQGRGIFRPLGIAVLLFAAVGCGGEAPCPVEPGKVHVCEFSLSPSTMIYGESAFFTYTVSIGREVEELSICDLMYVDVDGKGRAQMECKEIPLEQLFESEEAEKYPDGIIYRSAAEISTEYLFDGEFPHERFCIDWISRHQYSPGAEVSVEVVTMKVVRDAEALTGAWSPGAEKWRCSETMRYPDKPTVAAPPPPMPGPAAE